MWTVFGLPVPSRSPRFLSVRQSPAPYRPLNDIRAAPRFASLAAPAHTRFFVRKIAFYFHTFLPNPVVLWRTYRTKTLNRLVQGFALCVFLSVSTAKVVDAATFRSPRRTKSCFENPCVGGSIPPRATKELPYKTPTLTGWRFCLSNKKSLCPVYFRWLSQQAKVSFVALISACEQ